MNQCDGCKAHKKLVKSKLTGDAERFLCCKLDGSGSLCIGCARALLARAEKAEAERDEARRSETEWLKAYQERVRVLDARASAAEASLLALRGEHEALRERVRGLARRMEEYVSERLGMTWATLDEEAHDLRAALGGDEGDR